MNNKDTKKADESMLVSIVIVNWNGRKWLEKCLQTLESQTYKNFEIVFVDNASSDDSVAYVHENFPEVKIVETGSNLGFAGGNNAGIQLARGELILLVNNDTWVRPDFVQKLYNRYIVDGLDVVGPFEADYFSSKERGQYTSLIDPLGHQVYLSGSRAKNFFLTGVCLMFSKKLYMESGGLDDDFFMYCEEIDWFWRLNLLKRKFAYTYDTYIYHAGGGSIQHSKKMNYMTFLWRNQNALQMLLKNYGASSLVIILPIYFMQNIVEIVFFLCIGKPRIARSYVEGWVYNLKHLRRTIRKRVLIKKMRIASEVYIFNILYKGSGKLHNLHTHLSS